MFRFWLQIRNKKQQKTKKNTNRQPTTKMKNKTDKKAKGKN